MAYSVTFKVIPFDAFVNQPRGAGDLDFVLEDFDKTEMLTVVITDGDGYGTVPGGATDNIIDGDDTSDEDADDLNQLATVYDYYGNVVYSGVPIYVEWSAEYENDDDATDTLTMWRFELDRDFLDPGQNFRGFAVTTIPTDGATYVTAAKDMEVDALANTAMDDVVCFAGGTTIETTRGGVPIDELCVGDVIPTRRGQDQEIRWIGFQKLTQRDLVARPNLRPVRILAGALGDNLPRRDLLISRQHRMLVSSKIAQRMFDSTDVLISAIRLTALPGVYVDMEVDTVTYFHLLFDQHEVIFAEGAPSESLFTGPEALKAISDDAREEIFSLFPELETMDGLPKSALPMPTPKLQKRLISRHVKNEKPVLECYFA